MNDNIILIDWLAYTVKTLDVTKVIQYLGLGGVDWLITPGHYGYKNAKYYGGMWILYDGHSENMGVCVEFSGQGCRQYETSGNRSLEDLCNLVVNQADCNLTRLDVAFDDIDHEGNGLLDVKLIDKLAREDMYISKFGSKSGSWSGKHKDNGAAEPLAYSVYFGSAKSDVRFRIYDKSMERGGLDYHWSRFELQLRHDAGKNFLISEGAVGTKFYQVINNYLRFVVPDQKDSNRRRWASPEWWSKFLKDVNRISLYSKKDIEYNLSRVEQYIFSQCGNSILTYIRCVGSMYFWQKLSEREDYLNENQRLLIAEYEEKRQKIRDNLEKKGNQS